MIGCQFQSEVIKRLPLEAHVLGETRFSHCEVKQLCREDYVKSLGADTLSAEP